MSVTFDLSLWNNSSIIVACFFREGGALRREGVGEYSKTEQLFLTWCRTTSFSSICTQEKNKISNWNFRFNCPLCCLQLTVMLQMKPFEKSHFWLHVYWKQMENLSKVTQHLCLITLFLVFVLFLISSDQQSHHCRNFQQLYTLKEQLDMLGNLLISVCTVMKQGRWIELMWPQIRYPAHFPWEPPEICMLENGPNDVTVIPKELGLPKCPNC